MTIIFRATFARKRDADTFTVGQENEESMPDLPINWKPYAAVLQNIREQGAPRQRPVAMYERKHSDS